MSKTYRRVYGPGYRAGREATKWEKIKWLFCRRRVAVEEWLTDDKRGDADFLIMLFAGVAITAAGLIVYVCVG